MTTFAPRRKLVKPVVAQAPDPNAHLSGLAADLDSMVQDTKIMQKVNGAHLDAFEQHYPRQVAHCLRMTMERIQRSLEKRAGEDPHDPTTWRLNTAQLADLAEAAYYLDTIRRGQ
jgi:hypothetical protein